MFRQRGGARMGFPERLTTVLICTELNYSFMTNFRESGRRAYGLSRALRYRFDLYRTELK